MLLRIITSVLIFTHATLGFTKTCITGHVVDALEFNKDRVKLYKQDHGKKVAHVMKALMKQERIMIFFSLYYDFLASKYRKKGVNLFCEELSDIGDLPYTKQLPTPLSEQLREPFDVNPMREELLNSVKNDSYEEIVRKGKELLKEFHGKRTYCLTRHFIESITKSAQYAPKYIEDAEKAGLKSPEKLIRSYLRAQVSEGLKRMHKLDNMAYPLNSIGIPMYCQDIPDISID